MSKLFVDFDGVLMNTIKRITDLYNTDFNDDKKWPDVNSWSFSELNKTTPEIIDQYFDSAKFFWGLDYMDDAATIVPMIQDKWFKDSFYIVSTGRERNLKLKKWNIPRYFPEFDINHFIGIDINKFNDKSHIDMSGAVFIDDLSENLMSSNADIKICFGSVYPWNSDWNGVRCKTWFEVYRLINELSNIKE